MIIITRTNAYTGVGPFLMEIAGESLRRFLNKTNHGKPVFLVHVPTLTKTVTALIVGLGTAAVVVAADFETSMSQVQATLGITRDATTTLNGETVNTI